MADEVQKLTKDYDARIAAADEAERPKLEAEKYREIAALREGQLAQRDRQEWLRQAVSKYPDAIEAEVQGDSPEALEAAAAASHERMQARIAARVEAARAESPSAWGAGGSTDTGNPQSSASRAEQRDKKVLEEGFDLLRATMGLPSEQVVEVQDFGSGSTTRPTRHQQAQLREFVNTRLRTNYDAIKTEDRF